MSLFIYENHHFAPANRNIIFHRALDSCWVLRISHFALPMMEQSLCKGHTVIPRGYERRVAAVHVTAPRRRPIGEGVL